MKHVYSDMWVYILVGILILGLIYLVFLVFTPITLKINTLENTYKFKIKGLAEVWYNPTEFSQLRFRVFYIPFKVQLIEESPTPDQGEKNKSGEGKQKKDGKQKKGNSIQRNQRRVKWFLKKLLGFPSTFRIKRSFINIDMGDVITNSRLYPLYILNQEKYWFQVNYSGIVEIDLEIENRIWRVLKILFT